MAGLLGDVAGGDAAVEPGGHGGVAEVVGAAGKRGGVLVGCQCSPPGAVPEAGVGDAGEVATALTAEESVVVVGAEIGEMLA